MCVNTGGPEIGRPEKWRRARVRLRQIYRARGRCRCGRKRVPNRLSCRRCLASAMRSYRARKAVGCPHGILPGTFCLQCQDRRRTYWTLRAIRGNWVDRRSSQAQTSEPTVRNVKPLPDNEIRP